MHTTKDDIDIGKQIRLHLLPGALTTVVYVFLGRLFNACGVPSLLAFYAATLLVLFPLQLGLPVLLERKKHPGIPLRDIFNLQVTTPFQQKVGWIAISLVWPGLIFAVAGSFLVEPIKESLFSWLPEWFDLGRYLTDPQAYTQSLRVLTWVLSFFFAAFAGPLVEELYFRGYLLPRMSYLRGCAPLVSVVLMTLYHFWSPWFFIVRVLAMLPMVYAVWWKKDVTIGIYAHCLLNLVGDVLSAIPLVFG